MQANTQFFSSSIGKKVVMAVTGTILGMFLYGHLAGNLTIFAGRRTFINYAAHLHAIGPALHVIELALLAVFILHVFLGILLFIQSLNARPHRYAVHKSAGGRTLGSQTMPYTGALILLFIIIHLVNFHFTQKTATQTIADIVRTYLQQPGWAIFYIISLGLLTVHVSHGFWSLLQTLGINHPQYNTFLRFVATCLALVVGTLFILIPLFGLVSDNFLI